jgi:dTDP-glucose 4,6-dehydratase
MPTALVTGITGFIGSHLAARLVQLDYDVFGLVRPCASRDLKPIQPLLSEIALLSGDLTSSNSVMNVLRNANPDVIFHLAALSPVRYSFEHPFQFQEANYIGTLNIVHSLTELSDFKRRRLLVASTAEVYGMQDHRPFKEDLPLNPTSPYAVSKAAMDMYLRMAARVFDLDCVIMRPTNTYGRKEEKGFIVEHLISSMILGQKAYVGAPNSIRDYIHVSDHVEAYVLAAEHERAHGEVFNFGSGVGISNKDLTHKCSKMLNFNAHNIVFGSYPPGYPMRPLVSDQPYVVLDSSKAKNLLGWRPKVTLEQGLQMTIDYWKKAFGKS